MFCKSFSILHKEIMALLDELRTIHNPSAWVNSYLEDIETMLKAIEISSVSYRENLRIQKACNADLRDFHLVCQESYKNVYATSVCPEWMHWTSGPAEEFFAQLLENLKLLDAKTLHVLSLTSPKTLSTYEEHVHTLKTLKNQKTSRKDYEMLLALKSSLVGNKKLLVQSS